jgi:hypothetical protein
MAGICEEDTIDPRPHHRPHFAIDVQRFFAYWYEESGDGFAPNRWTIDLFIISHYEKISASSIDQGEISVIFENQSSDLSDENDWQTHDEEQN